jgi:hypothetical protein
MPARREEVEEAITALAARAWRCLAGNILLNGGMTCP